MGTMKNQNLPDEFIFAFQTSLSFWGIKNRIPITTTAATTTTIIIIIIIRYVCSQRC